MIIVSEDSSLYFLNSIESAQSYLEPEDIKNLEYLIFDSYGELLEQSISLKKRK